MTAVLKKRALAEYSHTIQEPPLQVPTKKLKLINKPAASSPVLALISCLESCKNSREVLRTLLRTSDNFELSTSDIPEVLKKLSDHFKLEAESAVRVKILSLLLDIGKEPSADIISIIDEAIMLIKNEVSHKVIAQGINTILNLGKLVTDNVSLHYKLVEIAKNYLKDVSHAVKCKCLETIGVLIPVCTGNEADKILELVSSYFDNEDARVRSQAFSTTIALHERGIKINPNVYKDVCNCLKDDYEIVRKVVLKLVWLLGITYPEIVVTLQDSEQEIRLIDDAF
ncbi:integrator complex subunit 4-like, partial [Agrilus planipennis]